jgi:hypothetical protein
MTRCISVGITCVALAVTAAGAGAQAPTDLVKKADMSSKAASAAAKAIPELVGALSQELSATPEQAAGAAGSLFGIAKSRLKPEEFAQVAKAVPGMDSLLKAAPALASVAGTTGALPGAGGSAGLASAATAFSKLGLQPDMVAKAVPVLTNFVSKSGGADVASLLSGVLK